MAMIVGIILCKLNFYFFIKNLKSKNKKLALTSFYCMGQQIWLGDSWQFIAQTSQNSTVSHGRVQKYLT